MLQLSVNPRRKGEEDDPLANSNRHRPGGKVRAGGTVSLTALLFDVGDIATPHLYAKLGGYSASV